LVVCFDPDGANGDFHDNCSIVCRWYLRKVHSRYRHHFGLDSFWITRYLNFDNILLDRILYDRLWDDCRCFQKSLLS